MNLIHIGKTGGSVRNPWDLVISTIKFRLDLYKLRKEDIMKYGEKRVFNKYDSMSNFYDIENNPNINIIKMENLEYELRGILKPINVDFNLKNSNIRRVNDSYNKIHILMEKYSNNIRIFNMETLNNPEGVTNILTFCGINKEDQILNTKIVGSKMDGSEWELTLHE